MDKLQIEAIETDAGYFIRSKHVPNYYSSISAMIDYFFDGKKPERTFHDNWLKIESKPQRVSKLVNQPPINGRYELINPSLASDKIPLVLYFKDVLPGDNEEGDYFWTNHVYEPIRSLYAQKSDPAPPKEEDVEFELNVILKIDNIKGYAGLSYPVQRTRWANEGTINITDGDVKHAVLDQILFPDIVLPSKPSFLTSEQSYKIIREHVIKNINPNYAKISSNYDFCFQVDKLIELCEPEEYKVDVSRNRRRSKYETRYRKSRTVKVFEMTHDKDNYKGYTPIKGFTGKNHEDLKNNIDEFLDNLMAKINEPLKDCPHCKGMGVIVES